MSILPGLDLRQVENVVDQREQVPAGAQHALQRLELVLPLRGRRASSCSISVTPMIAFSGVRSSCDMLARNCDLCWLATSSCSPLLLDLLEQPRVLDREHRLAGERLQQRHHRLRKLARRPRAGSPARRSPAPRAAAAPPAPRVCLRAAADRAAGYPRSVSTSGTWTGLRSLGAAGPPRCPRAGSAIRAGTRPWRRSRRNSPAARTLRSPRRTRRSCRRRRPSRARTAWVMMVTSTVCEVERGADRLADLPERAHFLDRARERLGARLELLEHADVLDGDHRLIGEGVEQLDVLCRRTCPPRARHGDAADGSAVAQQGHGEDRHGTSPPAPRSRRRTPGRPRCPGSGRRPGPGWRGRSRSCRLGAQRKVSFVRDRALGAQPVVSHEVDELAVEAEHRAELAVAQLHRALARSCRTPAACRSANS